VLLLVLVELVLVLVELVEVPSMLLLHWIVVCKVLGIEV
jgi:hypothetical protein